MFVYFQPELLHKGRGQKMAGRTGSLRRKNLSLDEIAAQSMISKSSALNLFRRYLYITPVNYLINYRLKQAALLLSHTEKKVSTISAETGFHNVDYFCRAFKKHYQVTPGEYRKEKWDK